MKRPYALMLWSASAALVLMSSAMARGPDGFGAGGPPPMGGPGGRGDEMPIERLLDRVDATDAQRKTIAETKASLRPKFEANMKGLRENREATLKLDPTAGDYLTSAKLLAATEGKLITEMGVLRAEQQAAVVKTLTPDQRKTLAELRAKRAEGAQCDCDRERGRDKR